MNSAYISVTTTATLLNTDTNELPGFGGNNVLLYNPSTSVTVYLGGSDVTADTTAGTGGLPLLPLEKLWVPCGPSEGLYGRVASGTQSVNVMRQGAS